MSAEEELCCPKCGSPAYAWNADLYYGAAGVLASNGQVMKSYVCEECGFRFYIEPVPEQSRAIREELNRRNGP